MLMVNLLLNWKNIVKTHATEKTLLRERTEPKSLRTQNQIQNETKFWKNQKCIWNENDNLEFKRYPKGSINPVMEKPKIKPKNRTRLSLLWTKELDRIW